MTINLSSRNLELMIGSENWTNWIDASQGIKVGYPEYPVEQGVNIVSGSIGIKFSRYDASLPSNPNSRFNPSQWKRGQLITIKITNTSGTLTYLPCSGQALYLLDIPKSPKWDMNGVGTITLQIGCRLAHESFPPEPNRDISGIVAGTVSDRGAIIANILNYLGISNSISMPVFGIDYPLPKVTGNWIGMCGQLAASAGYHLRCNSAGVVVAVQNNLTYTSNTETYTVGVDEKIFDPIGDCEQPLELTIFAGIQKTITANLQLAPVENYASYASVFPKVNETSPSTFQILRDRTITTITANAGQAVKTVEFWEAYGVTYPKVTPTNPPYFLSIKTRTITTYTLKNGLVTQTEVREFEAYGSVFSTVNPTFPSTFLIEKTRTTTTWAKIKEGLWSKTETIKEAYGVTYPKVTPTNPPYYLETKSSLISPDTTGAPTSIGDLSTYFITETQLSAKIYAQQLFVDPYRSRQRTIDVPFVVSQQQLVNFGQIFNKFLAGRSHGYTWCGAITDASLSFAPLTQVAVLFDGNYYYFKIDAIQYAITQTEAFILWNGIDIGTAPQTTPSTITPPLIISLGYFQCVGLSDLSVNIQTIKPASVIGLSDTY